SNEAAGSLVGPAPPSYPPTHRGNPKPFQQSGPQLKGRQNNQSHFNQSHGPGPIRRTGYRDHNQDNRPYQREEPYHGRQPEHWQHQQQRKEPIGGQHYQPGHPPPSINSSAQGYGPPNKGMHHVDRQRSTINHSTGRHDNPRNFEVANNVQKISHDHNWQRDRPGKYSEVFNRSSTHDQARQQHGRQQQHDTFKGPSGARAQQRPPRNGQSFQNNHNNSHSSSNSSKNTARYPSHAHQDGKGFSGSFNQNSQMHPQPPVTPAAHQPYNHAYGNARPYTSTDSYYDPNHVHQSQASGPYQHAPNHAQHQAPITGESYYAHKPPPSYQSSPAGPAPGVPQPSTAAHAAAPYPSGYTNYHAPPTANQQQQGGPYRPTYNNYPSYH
ncbi:hypothetical protein BGZ46_000503, partial [Entomortierella lignicola]